MTAKAFIGLVLLLPALFLAGSPQLLDSIEELGGRYQERPDPVKVDDGWRTAAVEEQRKDGWRGDDNAEGWSARVISTESAGGKALTDGTSSLTVAGVDLATARASLDETDLGVLATLGLMPEDGERVLPEGGAAVSAPESFDEFVGRLLALPVELRPQLAKQMSAEAERLAESEVDAAPIVEVLRHADSTSLLASLRDWPAVEQEAATASAAK